MNALILVNEKLTEIQLTLQSELKIKQSGIQSLHLENDKLRQELEACNIDKCRLDDSESHVRSEIRFLNQKMKSYYDGNDANSEIINEVKKLQKTQSLPKNQQNKKALNIQRNTLLVKNTPAVINLVKNKKMLSTSVNRMILRQNHQVIVLLRRIVQAKMRGCRMVLQ